MVFQISCNFSHGSGRLRNTRKQSYCHFRATDTHQPKSKTVTTGMGALATHGRIHFNQASSASMPGARHACWRSNSGRTASQGWSKAYHIGLNINSPPFCKVLKRKALWKKAVLNNWSAGVPE